MTQEKRIFYGGILLLIAGLLYSYEETFSFSFIDYDDPAYLGGNPLSGESLFSLTFWSQLFTTSTVNLWHPLTVLSHQLAYRLTTDWGIHHALNLFLHASTAVLWGVLLFKLLGKALPAVVAVLFFSWHPVTVEAVAWLSGRKDLLCGLFLILSLLFHLRWVQERKHWDYTLSLLMGTASMLCKPTAVVLPIILLLLEVSVQKGSPPGLKGLRTYAGWLLPVGVTLFCTLSFQSAGGQALPDPRSLLERFSGALWSTGKAGKAALYPMDLHLGYEDPASLSLLFLFIGIGLALLLCFLFLRYRTRFPYLFCGLFLFLLFLLPTVGIIRAGNHLAADRYLYLPLLGISLMLAAFLSRRSWIVQVCALPLLLLFLPLQKRQASTWESLETVARQTLKVHPENPTGNAQLAYLFYERGEKPQALHFTEETLSYAPDHVGGNLLRAAMAKEDQQWETAETHYRSAIKTRKNDPLLWQNFSLSLLQQGKFKEGVSALKEARNTATDRQHKEELEAEISSIEQQLRQRGQ